MEYALIKNGIVEGVIVADEAFVAQIAAEWDAIVPATDGCGPGWAWTAQGGFVRPESPPEPEPVEPPRHLAPASFKRRLTQTERIAIREASKVSAEVYDFMDLLDTSKYIDLDDPLTQYGLQHLELSGLPLASNPKTSTLAALSAVRACRELALS